MLLYPNSGRGNPLKPGECVCSSQTRSTMSRTTRKMKYHSRNCRHGICEWCFPRDKYLKRVVGWKKRIKNHAVNIERWSNGSDGGFWPRKQRFDPFSLSELTG